MGNIELPFNRLTSHAFPPVLTYDGVAPSRTTVDWLILQGGSGECNMPELGCASPIRCSASGGVE